MSINLSLADLFEHAFGYKSKAFDPSFAPLPPKKQESGTGSAYYNKDIHGREYYLPVTIGFRNKVAEAAITTATYNYTPPLIQQFELSHPVISISARKIIIETQLTERRGTVKQLIGTEDHEISIKGLIIGRDNEYPEQEVGYLHALYELNEAVQIRNVVTDIFLMTRERGGSDHVVIKELKLPEVRGVKNVVAYELLMVSDEPFTLDTIE